jgi:hypothetical protein
VVRIAVVALVLALPAVAAAADVQSRTLVTYQRTGGFTGKQESLTVLRSGAATSSNGAFQLTPRRRLRLESALKNARFATLRSDYLPPEPVADSFTYTVRYGGKRVSVRETAQPPERLQRVLLLLSDILSRRG